MKLVRTTFLSGLVSLIRISSGFVAGKVIAIYAGPAGVALIGSFTNFISIVLAFGNGAINTGVVKYTSDYEGDEGKLKSLFSTSFKITAFCSIICGIILIFLAGFISKWLFILPIYANPIRVLGFSLFFYSLNLLFISILNGKGEIKTYTLVNTIGTIVGLVFTVLLVYQFKTIGALYSLVITQSVVFFVTAALIFKSPWFNKSFFLQAFDKAMAIKLSHYSLMAIVTAMTIPLSQILVRNMLVSKLGVDYAGYWQGMMRISDGYLMLVTTSLATYYLPKLSSLKEDNTLKREIFNGYKLILPAMLIGCLIIFFMRFYIIKVLFTQDFMLMEKLFYWQLVGDFFKIAAWMLAYLMLAKSMTRLYIITEIIFGLSYVIISNFMVDRFHLEGVSIAFAINYLIYLIVMVYLFRRLLFKKSLEV